MLVFFPFFGDSFDADDDEEEEEEVEEEEVEEEGGNLKGRWPMLTTTASPSSNDRAGYSPAAELP